MLYKYNISDQTCIGIFTFLFMMIIVLLCASYNEGMSKKYIELNNYLQHFHKNLLSASVLIK
ncbi:hypothetical protein EMUR_01775 [Ehrlichia muris AS145]|uniref:Uncharacterized protein n=1 Tax=Ehrlichia muris AS145 TaxID=1423892 RepID=V9RA78_9RICK|nr:hypothetical protein EMUR_01775 [Ehrlichia muris AS145]